MLVAGHLEDVRRAELRGRGEQVVAMLHDRGLARVHDAVELTQRLVPRNAGDTVIAQIANERRAVDLLDGDRAQRHDLPLALPRARDEVHLVFVAHVPQRVSRRIREQLAANALRDLLVSEEARFVHRPLGLAHQSRSREVDHFFVFVLQPFLGR